MKIGSKVIIKSGPREWKKHEKPYYTNPNLIYRSAIVNAYKNKELCTIVDTEIHNGITAYELENAEHRTLGSFFEWEIKNPPKRWAAILLLFLSVIAVLGVFAACGAYLVNGKVQDSFAMMQTVDKEEIVQMTNENLSEETALRLKDSWTVAAFGLDSRESDELTGTNSDVIMLITLNGKTGEVKLASIYRDTCLKTGNGIYKKANSAYATGGPKRAVAMLNENLDLKIDDYIAVNWKAVADAVNVLGGVDLEITDTEFEYINSFITETVESTGLPSAHLKHHGQNHLDGVQTVAYCRLRLMDNDFKRTERQQKVLGLLLEKAAHADYKTLNGLINTLLPQTSSSIDARDLYAVAGNILRLKKPEAIGFPSINFCRTVEGASYVFPDTLARNVMDLHQFLYGNTKYTPSDAVMDISYAVKKKSQKEIEKKNESTKTESSEPIITETPEFSQAPAGIKETETSPGHHKEKAEPDIDTWGGTSIITDMGDLFEDSQEQSSAEFIPYGPGFHQATEGAMSNEQGSEAMERVTGPADQIQEDTDITQFQSEKAETITETEESTDVYME